MKIAQIYPRWLLKYFCVDDNNDIDIDEDEGEVMEDLGQVGLEHVTCDDNPHR